MRTPPGGTMRRLLGVALLAATAAVACEPIGVSGLSVGGREVSRSTLEDELTVLATHPDLTLRLAGIPLAPSEVSIPSTLASAWLSFRALVALAASELDRRDVSVTDADVAASRDRFDFVLGSSLRRAPAKFRVHLVQDYAAVFALTRVEGIDFATAEGSAALQQLFRRVARRVPVEIDPRFGTWRQRSARVVPPAAVNGIGDESLLQG